MQHLIPTNKGRLKKSRVDTFTPIDSNAHRYPKPPGIPRSQSSKDLQAASKSSFSLKTGRKVMHRSYSLPNVSSPNEVKLPKASRHFAIGVRENIARTGFNNGAKGQNLNSVGEQCHFQEFKRQNINKKSRGQNRLDELNSQNLNSVFKGKTPGFKELPDVRIERKLVRSLPEKGKGLFSMLSSLDNDVNKQSCESVSFIGESVFDLNQKSSNTGFNKPPSAKRHGVFIIDHEDGRLQAASNLNPVPEEPEHQPFINSPWLYHSNESSPQPKNSLFQTANQEPSACMTQQSPWNCHGDESKNNVVDDLFDSDDEGLVVKKHQSVVDNGLDPVKKAMIDSWINDVTLNISRTNKK